MKACNVVAIVICITLQRSIFSEACKFKDFELIPDVIDVGPKAMLNVSFPSGVDASFGNMLTPTEVKDQPTVLFPAEPEATYTLILTDPDVPDREQPVDGEWIHWLVVNIPGRDLALGDISKGEVLREYVGAAPPEGSGYHRYAILAYKQPEELDFNEKKLDKTMAKDRYRFKTRMFVDKYNLKELSAGNFFQAKYDDYVPTVYQQFKS
uniref:Phosphatidylethanolamine-binding protein n=1 Tax=Timema cristinae TaxID=61476 RepID=A0A7R9CF12_TIMCR|nr:unnamed protein product [Timema cristinae]